jgi:hypothetical protein
MKLAYRGIQLFWYLEFQKRGAPHFHGIIDKGIDESELKKMWYEIVYSNYKLHLEHGAHVKPIRSLEGYTHYLTDYLTKEEQKIVPVDFRDVGRFWGYSRSLLDPYIIKIIIGTESEIRSFRRKHIRPLRRWMDNQRKFWKSKKKPKKITNLYSNFLPGKYLTAINGRKFINELKSRGLDVSLFESGGECPVGEADGHSPLTL